MEVSFQGETYYCLPNNPQSDAGSDTQDTNTMTSMAAGWRQQNAGSMEQWEKVSVSSHKYTNTYNTYKETQILDVETYNRQLLRRD